MSYGSWPPRMASLVVQSFPPQTLSAEWLFVELFLTVRGSVTPRPPKCQQSCLSFLLPFHFADQVTQIHSRLDSDTVLRGLVGMESSPPHFVDTFWLIKSDSLDKILLS